MPFMMAHIVEAIACCGSLVRNEEYAASPRCAIAATIYAFVLGSSGGLFDSANSAIVYAL